MSKLFLHSPLLAVLLFAFLLACQSAGPEPLVDCLGEEDIANMRAEYLAHSDAAMQEHFLDQVCLDAEIDLMSNSESFARVGGKVEEASFLIVHYKKGPSPDANEEQRRRSEEDARRAPILEAWMKDKEIGDAFQAMCVVDGFDDEGELRPLGTPKFWDCVLPE